MHIRITLSIFLLAILVAGVTWGTEPALGTEQVISAQDMDEYRPQVAFNSNHNEYLVVWHDNASLESRSVKGKRVDMNGDTIQQFTIAFDDRDNALPTVEYDATDDVYLVAWIHDFSGDETDWDIHGRIVPWDGPIATLPSFSICVFASSQWDPRVAVAGTLGEFIVTWWNEGSGENHSYISAQRVSPSGSLIDGNFNVTSGSEERVGPDIAFNRATLEYLIVYQRMDVSGDIYGIRLSSTGSILGGGDFAIAAWPDPETKPRVSASQGSNEWGVVWQSDVPGAMKDIYARRVWVDWQGAIQTSAPVLVASTSLDERSPDIAIHTQGDEYLITWEGQYSNTSGPFGIFARTLDSESNTLGPQIEPRGIWAGESVSCSRPAVAASPNGWFVAWEHDRNDTPPYQDIHGRAVFGPLFADGFESGNFSAWADHTP